jgi:hypothetical protein
MIMFEELAHLRSAAAIIEWQFLHHSSSFIAVHYAKPLHIEYLYYQSFQPIEKQQRSLGSEVTVP